MINRENFDIAEEYLLKSYKELADLWGIISDECDRYRDGVEEAEEVSNILFDLKETTRNAIYAIVKYHEMCDKLDAKESKCK